MDLSFRMAEDGPRMARDSYWAGGIQPDLYIDEYVRIRTCLPYVYGLVALLHDICSD